MREDNILEVRGLSVTFSSESGRVYALRGVDFSLSRGETLAIVGESGSGKSVTSRAIMRLLSPNATVAGEIVFHGEELLSLSEREMCRVRGRRISMIFQDPMSSLNPIVKVGRQLTEAMRMNGVGRAEAKKRSLELLSEVGIDDPEKRYKQYPFELSGGMRQRIVIAIALGSDPDLLICDEPTTALDVTIQSQILDLINKIKKERALSVIFITHDLGVVAGMADRIAVMYAGKIVEYGRCEEIFYEPAHPYTRALLSSMPDLGSKDTLFEIPGSPPDMRYPPRGDAFALRSEYALNIDFESEPPLFRLSDTHYARTWLCHKDAPRVEIPKVITERIERMKRVRESMKNAD